MTSEGHECPWWERTPGGLDGTLEQACLHADTQGSGTTRPPAAEQSNAVCKAACGRTRC